MNTANSVQLFKLQENLKMEWCAITSLNVHLDILNMSAKIHSHYENIHVFELYFTYIANQPLF